MSRDEYINASLALVCDDSAFDIDDLQCIVKHIHEVSTDGLCRPSHWKQVLKWSQSIWDDVEMMRCSWHDASYIKDQRVKVSWMGVMQQAVQPPPPRPHRATSYVHSSTVPPGATTVALTKTGRCSMCMHVITVRHQASVTTTRTCRAAINISVTLTPTSTHSANSKGSSQLAAHSNTKATPATPATATQGLQKTGSRRPLLCYTGRRADPKNPYYGPAPNATRSQRHTLPTHVVAK